MIPANRLVLAAAYPGEGKSLIEEVMLYSIAYGAPFAAKYDVTPGHVMFIDSENRRDILASRCLKIIKGLEMNGYSKKRDVDFQHYSGFLLDNKSTWPAILNEVDAIKPSIIVLDHLRCFHNQTENDSDSMKKVTDALEKLMAQQNSTVYVNHHFNKTDQKGTFLKRLRGTSALLAITDTAFEVRALSRKTIGDTVHLEKVGMIFQPRKDLTPKPIRLKIEEGDDWLTMKYDGDYQPVDDPRLDDLAHRFYHHVFLEQGGIWCVNDVRDEISGYAKDDEIRGTLRYMEETLNLITSIRKGLGGGFNYSINNPSGATKLECPWCKQSFAVSKTP